MVLLAAIRAARGIEAEEAICDITPRETTTVASCASHVSLAGRAERASPKEITVGRITFHKRQKEMKRQEKQRMKAEKRVQRKIAKKMGLEVPAQPLQDGGLPHASEQTGAAESFE